MPIPKYAQRTPRNRLVQIICRGACGGTRYAEVSQHNWSGHGPNEDPDLYATCLKCGYKAKDKYNWIRV